MVGLNNEQSSLVRQSKDCSRGRRLYNEYAPPIPLPYKGSGVRSVSLDHATIEESLPFPSEPLAKWLGAGGLGLRSSRTLSCVIMKADPAACAVRRLSDHRS